MVAALVKVDIGHGRGWLAPAPAASLRRIDAQLGRLADINEAGRSPEQADENRRKWLAYERYLNGGPWAPKAPYALGSDQSVHCWGYAADTDDWYSAQAAQVWRDNGWGQTARYPGNKAKDEPWHGEYFAQHDKYAGSSAGEGTSGEWDEMATREEVKQAALEAIDAFFKAPKGSSLALGPGGRNVWDTFDFIAGMAGLGVAENVWGHVLTALDETGNPRRDAQGKPIRFQAWGFLSSIAAQVQANGPVDVDEAALAAALAPLITANLETMSDTDVQRIAEAAADEQARRLAS